MKGEESGHTQKVRELRIDCDGDAIVILIAQNDGIACHKGRESCSYKVSRGNTWETADAILNDEKEIYSSTQ